MLKAIGHLLEILAGFLSPGARKRRARERDLKKVKKLEAEYGKALADGDPERAQEVAHELRELRERLRLLDAD